MKSPSGKFTLYCDLRRHLICEPYSVENLHAAAAELGIKRCWYHGGRHPHYDIPKRRVVEITAKCTLLTPRKMMELIRPRR